MTWEDQTWSCRSILGKRRGTLTLRSVDSSRRQTLVLSRIFRIFEPADRAGWRRRAIFVTWRNPIGRWREYGFFTAAALRATMARWLGPERNLGERGTRWRRCTRNARGDQDDMFCVLRRSDRRRGHRSFPRRRNVQPLNPGIKRPLDPAGSRWMDDGGRRGEIYENNWYDPRARLFKAIVK